MDEQFNGKNVFFLYPHSVIQEELIIELIRNEYQVSVLHDHEKTLKLLIEFNNSILFINIDTVLKEQEWEKYVKDLMTQPETKEVKVGIVSYYSEESIVKKYLFELNVSCGFIKLKTGSKESTQIILKVLEANEAKGHRKYVRAKGIGKSHASFNVSIDGTIRGGFINDISSVGMALIFDDDVKLINHSKLIDIQLRLSIGLCNATGTIMGMRHEEMDIVIIIFDANTSKATKEKIHHFIAYSLQFEIDEKMKAIK